MSTDTQQAEQTDETPFVRVAQMASDTQRFEFERGQTVNDYLEQAGISVGRGQVITLNGEKVNGDASVAPDSVIAVTGKVANG